MDPYSRSITIVVASEQLAQVPGVKGPERLGSTVARWFGIYGNVSTDLC